MSEVLIRHTAIRRGRSVVLEAGEIRAPLPAGIALVGVNGSGKSSLFMHLAGNLERHAHARMLVDGAPSSVAYAPQEPALPRWLSAERTAHLYGIDFRAAADRMPGLFLQELRGTSCGFMSVGQRQALAVALALGRDAGVTLLDEPFAALDFRRRAGLVDILRERVAGGARRALLISSQSAADLSAICSHYTVLRNGRYVFNGTAHELTRDGVNDIESGLLALLV